MKSRFLFCLIICFGLSTSLTIKKNDPTFRTTPSNPSNRRQKIKFRRSQISEDESDLNNLVEVPVSYKTGLSYYYPYFYKARLITFADSENRFYGSTTKSNESCSIQNCDLCVSNSTICRFCNAGYYLYNNTCVDVCPPKTYADNLRAKCLPFNKNIDIFYSIAFSIGSCHNMCGKKLSDCSCAPSCKQSGNCCTDFDTVNCDYYFEKNATADRAKCVDMGCELCETIIEENYIKKPQQRLSRLSFSNSTNNNTNLSEELVESYANTSEAQSNTTEQLESKNLNNATTFTQGTLKNQTHVKCYQCNSSRYFLNGDCLEQCPQGFLADGVNRICRQESAGCTEKIADCEKCSRNPGSSHASDTNKILHCIKCKKGKYLLKNQCVQKCPDGTRADRITWTCIKPPFFSWYWVYPSKGSCKGKCELNESSECSCRSVCIQEGNCCSDYDSSCLNHD